MFGYIIDDSDKKWTLHMVNNEIVKLRKLMVCKEDGEYKYANIHGRHKNRRVITKYWPNRFMIYKSGESKCTLNRVAI